MTKTIDYFVVQASPWAYLGSLRLGAMATRHKARVLFKPFALSEKVFPVSGGLPLEKRAPQRQAYRLAELRRWRDYLGIPLNPEPKYFPCSSRLGNGMVIAARQRDLDCASLSHAILRALWAEERNTADPETLSAIAAEVGMDGNMLLEAAESDAVVQEYDANTDEAIARGVFGAPTFIYNDELFWGQDRLELLDWRLAGD